jgi:uncharacterized protein
MSQIRVPGIPGADGVLESNCKAASLIGELYAVPLEEDRFLIYAPLQHSAFIGNGEVARRIRLLQGGAVRCDAPDPWFATLVQLLAALGMIRECPETPPVRRGQGEPQPTSVTLFLTNSCNLRCRYCYASSGEFAPKSMTLETARNGIDFVFKNASARKADRVHVGYHGGGEPALNWAVLTGSTAYAREYASQQAVRLSVSLATNGVLSDSQIDWVVGNVNSATVSFDGLPAVHDHNRVTVAGRATSGRVMHTMKRFDEAGFRYGVRATVLAEQVERLPESVEFICANFQAPNIQVEPVYQLGRGGATESADAEAFVESFRAARARAEKHGRKLRFSGARIDSVSNHFCSATSDSFCLSPDGNVTSCFEAFSEDAPLASMFFYGRPGPAPATYEFDHQVLSGLRASGVENRAFCRECFAKWTCAGDCLYKVLTTSGGGEPNAAGRCQIIRELTKDLILKKLADSGGLAWRGRRGARATCSRAPSPSRKASIPMKQPAPRALEQEGPQL